MNINDKIINYLDYKGVSQRQFTSLCKLSEGVLRRGKNIGSGYLKVIKTNYPDLNMNWLLFDEGEMIKKQKLEEDDLAFSYNLEIEEQRVNEMEGMYNDELLMLQRKLIETQEELIKAKQNIIELKEKIK